MTKLTSKDIEHIARLANLTLSKVEVIKFQKELSGIVEYVAKLSELDTSKVAAASRSSHLINVVRPDSVNSARYVDTQTAISQSAKSYNNFFAVPLIIKTKDVHD